MIELKVINYLKEALGMEGYAEFPENAPESFIVCEKTGSSREEMIDYATIAIQSYAPSMYLAAELNEKVKDAMDGIVNLSSVTSVELNSDYNFTDLSMKRYRYQAVFELTHY